MASLAVMICVFIPLSLRKIEDLLFERGISDRHEAVWLRWNRFGPKFAADIGRQRVNRMRSMLHWRWHLDERYGTTAR